MCKQDASKFFAPSHLICPDCSEPMHLSTIVPARSRHRIDEITYLCQACGAGIKLVTGPVDDAASYREPVKLPSRGSVRRAITDSRIIKKIAH
jgi:hypothetical protein